MKWDAEKYDLAHAPQIEVGREQGAQRMVCRGQITVKGISAMMIILTSVVLVIMGQRD